MYTIILIAYIANIKKKSLWIKHYHKTKQEQVHSLRLVVWALHMRCCFTGDSILLRCFVFAINKGF